MLPRQAGAHAGPWAPGLLAPAGAAGANPWGVQPQLCDSLAGLTLAACPHIVPPVHGQSPGLAHLALAPLLTAAMAVCLWRHA